MPAPAEPVDPARLAAAAARLEEAAPGWLDEVRRRAAALGVPRTPGERARRAVDLVTATASVSADAPVLSRRRSAATVKRAVGTLTRFYFLHVVSQVNEMGESTAWMGSALCDYVAALEAEVEDLRRRVTRLEEGRTGP